jgi:hypothetical protein
MLQYAVVTTVKKTTNVNELKSIGSRFAYLVARVSTSPKRRGERVEMTNDE